MMNKEIRPTIAIRFNKHEWGVVYNPSGIAPTIVAHNERGGIFLPKIMIKKNNTPPPQSKWIHILNSIDQQIAPTIMAHYAKEGVGNFLKKDGHKAVVVIEMTP